MMRSMKNVIFILALLVSTNVQAMRCHIETDYIAGVYKKVEGVCSKGYRFKIEGPAVGLKFEKTDYFGISCSSDDKAGEYYGLGIDIGFAKGFTGAVFIVPEASYSSYMMSSVKACLVGGLEDPALLYVGFAITQLKISYPTKQSIEEAKHFGLD